MKKAVIVGALTVFAAGMLAMPCRAQEIVSTVPVCGLWAFDAAQLDALGEFEQASITLAPAGAVVWLDDHAVGVSDSLSREELARVRIFSSSPHPAAGISPLYSDGSGQTRERLKIRCINPVF